MGAMPSDPHSVNPGGLGDIFATALLAARFQRELSLEELLTALEDEDWRRRQAAAEVLGERGSQQAVARLLSVLKDKQPDVRAAAAYALGDIGDRAAVEPLMSVLLDDEDGPQRAAADALGELGDARAAETLFVVMRRASEGDPDLLVSTSCALGWVGDRRAIESLLRIAGDIQEEEFEPAYQADALGCLADLGLRQPLEEAVSDESRGDWMRELAAERLASVGESPSTGLSPG